MPSRRHGFMTLVSAAALALTGGVGALAATREEPADPRVVEESAELARAFGWSAIADGPVVVFVAQAPFRIDLPNGEILADPPPSERAAEVAALIAGELALLPPGFLRAAGLERVVLCDSLTESRRPIPSLPNWRGTLLLDVGGTPAFLRRLLHHEVWHFADLADDGDVGADGVWPAVAGFAYGAGGRSMRRPEAARPASAPAGFVTPYATAALEEDKAETFAFLVTEPHRTRARALGDPILAAKIDRIRELGAALGLDEAFWRRLEAWRER
jgi:hypothetical protein